VGKLERSKRRRHESTFARLRPAILKHEVHSRPKVLDGFLFGEALAVGFGNLWTECREPFAFRIDLSRKGKGG
jgi:hypothetical protein